MTNKLPIPRLQRERRDSGGRRTSRACDSCRERKTKCDGNKPVCSQCRSLGLANCFYSEAKFVRQQKELESVRRKVERYEELLRSISTDLEGPIANRAANALRDPSARSTKHQSRTSSTSSSSSLGSLDENEVVNEDINRDEKSRATGYIGKNSEVVWMQRLESEATRQGADKFHSSRKSHRLPTDDSIASVNYHLDHRSLSDQDVTNAFVLPPKGLVDRLFQVYLEKVQTSLPFIRQDLFHDQYHRCYASTQNPGRKWLAIFNLILAIGCAFSRLSQQDVQPNGDENLFFSRARSLSVSENVLYDHDDLQQVQAEALMAFFLLVVSQINRSWKMIGIAARSGIALGLNLQKNDGLDMKSSEARNQLWWSVFRLEHLLSVMTGRVSCLGDASSSTPPPLALENLAHSGYDIHQPISAPYAPISAIQWSIHLDREQMESQSTLVKSFTPNPSLYFFYMVDLSLIAHAISNGVYASDSSRIGWSRIESRIALYGKKVDHWVLSLHPSFCFEDNHKNQLPGSRSAFQISLALNYYSARIILNRPCLKRPGSGKKSGTRLTRSRFSNTSAMACLQASLGIMRLLPDQTNLAWCYEILQWWDFLHVLTQATVILLLDVSIGSVATSSEEAAVLAESAKEVLNGVKRGLSWLHCLGSTSEAARRSFRFCNACIRRMATTQDLDLSGIPSPATSSATSRDPQDGNQTVSQQEVEGVPVTGHSKPVESPRSSQGESDDLLFQDPQDAQPPMGSLQNPFALYDTDIDMLDYISFPNDAEVEDLLLSMMRSNA